MRLVPNLHYDFNFSRFHICPNVIYTFAHICQPDQKAGPSSSSSPVCNGKKAKKNCRKELPVKIVAADQASACSFLGINCSLVGNKEDKNKCRQSHFWPWTCKISCHRSHISEKAWINRKKNLNAGSVFNWIWNKQKHQPRHNLNKMIWNSVIFSCLLPHVSGKLKHHCSLSFPSASPHVATVRSHFFRKAGQRLLTTTDPITFDWCHTAIACSWKEP